MSFRVGHWLSQTIRFILGLFFLLVGLFSVALPWSDAPKQALIQLINEETLMLSLFGLGFTLIGVSILIYIFLHTSHRYIQMRIGSRAVTLDENVIHQYLNTYWKEHFPKHHIPSHLIIKKEAIQIIANLPSLSEDKQSAFLEKMKKDFADIFGRILGYSDEIHLIVSFQSHDA